MDFDRLRKWQAMSPDGLVPQAAARAFYDELTVFLLRALLTKAGAQKAHKGVVYEYDSQKDPALLRRLKDPAITAVSAAASQAEQGIYAMLTIQRGTETRVWALSHGAHPSAAKQPKGEQLTYGEAIWLAQVAVAIL